MASESTPAPGVKRTIRLRIKRCAGPGQPTRWEEFNAPIVGGDGANVIACLKWIAQHPVTAQGQTTTPVVWDAGCLEEVCGACTMVINGRVRQSCSCLMDVLAPRQGDVVTLEPMSKFPVIRDLWVDRSRIFHNLERIKGWAPIDGLHDLGPGPEETPEQWRTHYSASECMSCGCCLEACPQFQLAEPQKWDTSFVGANTLAQVRMFNQHKTAGELAGERLDTLMEAGGVSDCGNAQNCVKVCPKEIPLTEAIAAIGRAATIHGFKRFFSGD